MKFTIAIALALAAQFASVANGLPLLYPPEMDRCQEWWIQTSPDLVHWTSLPCGSFSNYTDLAGHTVSVITDPAYQLGAQPQLFYRVIGE